MPAYGGTLLQVLKETSRKSIEFVKATQWDPSVTHSTNPGSKYLTPGHGHANLTVSMSSGPFLGKTLLNLTDLLRGGRTLQRLDEIERAAFQPPEAIAAMQMSMLQTLLRHAETKVPYYRELFRSLGITSKDFRTPKDLSRLPILTKDIVRERRNDLLREDVDPATLMPHFSGGSTGVPLSFLREKSYMDYSQATVYRSFQQCGWRPGDMVAFFWGGNDKLYAMKPWEFDLRQRLRRAYLLDPFYSGPKEMDGWIAKWPSIAPVIAQGYASTIARFAAHVEERGQKLPPLRGVFTTAEKLYPAQRELIARVFQCHVYDCYGSSEVQAISFECPKGNMHIQADSVILEEDHSAQIPAGGSPPLLVTSLRNFAMPFLRYRNEDCGEVAEASERCSCGNGFPLMRLKIGRISDNFRLPSGRVVHGEFFTHMMYGTQGIETFQFHQTAPGAITLWIVPTSGHAAERAQAIRSAREQLENLDDGFPIAVDIRETDSIPLTNAGKHRFVRTDVAADSVQPVQDVRR